MACATVLSTSMVRVAHIDCTTTGASPPTLVPPIVICRVFRSFGARSISTLPIADYSRILNRARKMRPHPRRWRGLSRNQAGEAGNQWRGTRHPNPTLTFILSLAGRGEELRAELCKYAKLSQKRRARAHRRNPHRLRDLLIDYSRPPAGIDNNCPSRRDAGRVR